MNRSGEIVNRKQLRENERCLLDYQNDQLVSPMTFDECITADLWDKVQKAGDRTVKQEGIQCDSLDVPPPFAYTDSETVNSAAVAGALALTYDIFGGPAVLDDDLVTKADNKKLARCQYEMLRRADLLESAVLKEINKAKRRTLRGETVDSAAGLSAELQTVFLSNDKIQRLEDRLVKQVDNTCDALQVPPATLFPGQCADGNISLSEIEVCVIEAARCEACLKINAFDDLTLDCDLADDQSTNGSCGVAAD